MGIELELEAEEVIYQYYAWIVVVGSFFMFGTAMGIGANDVANAFATSVGSKALSLKGAIIIASCVLPLIENTIVLPNCVCNSCKSSQPKLQCVTCSC